MRLIFLSWKASQKFVFLTKEQHFTVSGLWSFRNNQSQRLQVCKFSLINIYKIKEIDSVDLHEGIHNLHYSFSTSYLNMISLPLWHALGDNDNEKDDLGFDFLQTVGWVGGLGKQELESNFMRPLTSLGSWGVFWVQVTKCDWEL